MGGLVFSRLVISNAFSTNMLEKTEIVVFVKLDIDTAKYIVNEAVRKGIDILSIVGHQATADLLSRILNINISVNRADYKLLQNDLVLVFTIPVRLPEGRILTDEEIKQYSDKLNIYAVFLATEGFKWLLKIIYDVLRNIFGLKT